MSVKVDIEDNLMTLTVIGRFDINVQSEFRGAFESQNGSVRMCVVDLSEVSHMDSSALGMLLLLRDWAGKEGAQVSLVGANKDIMEILHIANFEKMFSISAA